MEKEFKFLIYNSVDDNVSVNAIVKDESIWLTQKAMGELFGVQTPAISKHLKNIFDEGELDDKVVVSKMEITTQHGAMSDKTQTKEAQFYNLDAIISVGYADSSLTGYKVLPSSFCILKINLYLCTKIGNNVHASKSQPCLFTLT